MATVVLFAAVLTAAVVLSFAGVLLSPVVDWANTAGADGATVNALTLLPDGAIVVPIAAIALLTFPLLYVAQKP